ncbi:hypothetical protein HNY73_014270 [Argiope bruennichi]|uniref:Uncharacterized protein n=1 Tax=Argiope bruennichi TaxID=94029 RepID=A0A8T0ENF8_ARGBR|nr:hypothetical protein HNY73_014270 [Argiope bruennichi]
MFKVQDNPDGSTSIYCKNSGNLLCTIPGKRNCRAPRRVNVVEPQHESLRDESARLNDENEGKPRTRQSKCCLSPIPISVDGDQSEDYFDDCITQDEFAKCLNLISKEKLQTESKDRLLAEYPLRLLSRSKAYRTLEDSPAEDLRDLKLPDDMPLTSCLGMKILQLNEERNFVTEMKIMMSLRRYDDYCRIPFNTNKPSACNFPKLRCREKKTYPITSLLKSSKHEANHFYTYGRRQRMDRIITLKTGLDARSRRLLRLCNKQKWIVELKKLTQEEIESWKNKSIPSDEQFSLIEQSNLPTIEILRPNTVPTSSSSDLSWKEIRALLPPGTSLLKIALKAPEASSSSLKQHKKKCRGVAMTDVTNYITKREDGFYYFKNQSIRIPFYEEFLSSLRMKKLLNNRRVTEGRNPNLNKSQMTRFQKSVSILKPLIINSNVTGYLDFGDSNMNFPKVATAQNFSEKIAKYSSEIAISQNVATHGLTEIKIKRQEGMATPIKERLSSTRLLRTSAGETRQTEVPVIDLTGDSPPEKPVIKQFVPKTERLVISQWKFTCFRCGYNHFYLSHTYDRHSVETAVHEHMNRIHSVANPESSLSRYIDRVNKCAVIEAFTDLQVREGKL